MRIATLMEYHIFESRKILRESCDGLTAEQQIIVEGIYNDLSPLIEASLAPQQIQQLFGEIEKAIRNSNLGLNPMNDGELIRLSIPPLTEERRRDLVKRVKQEIEVAKINVRNARQDGNNSIKKLKGEGVSEDDIKSSEDRIQKMTDGFISKIDVIFADKEKDIMSV